MLVRGATGHHLPSIPENPTGDGLKMIALIVVFVVFFITVLTSS